eukprot:1759700-Prymnesium_polylepis.1
MAITVEAVCGVESARHTCALAKGIADVHGLGDARLVCAEERAPHEDPAAKRARGGCEGGARGCRGCEAGVRA